MANSWNVVGLFTLRHKLYPNPSLGRTSQQSKIQIDGLYNSKKEHANDLCNQLLDLANGSFGSGTGRVKFGLGYVRVK